MFRRHPPLKDLRVYDLETFWGVKQTTFRKEEKKSSGGGRYPVALEPLKRLKRLEKQILNRPTAASELEKELNEEESGPIHHRDIRLALSGSGDKELSKTFDKVTGAYKIIGDDKIYPYIEEKDYGSPPKSSP